MRCKWQNFAIGLALLVFTGFLFTGLTSRFSYEKIVLAQTSPSPQAVFDRQSELAKLREAIKGKESEPAEKVFKNLQMTSMKSMPASRILAIMEFGYSRSLGVDCTHCHTPGKYEAEDKPQKQIAREMAGLVATLNTTTLKAIKNLKGPNPTVNCTTCHRGEIKPALNLPTQR